MAHASFRGDFDLDESLIYLNSGTQSICPRPVIESVISHLRAYERNPTDQLIRSWDGLWQVQRQLAAFVGAAPQDLFFRPNVTTVMNDFILGSPLAPGGEILVSDAEYGAVVNICRYRAERDGLALRAFHLPGRAEELTGLTEDSLVEIVTRELKPQTRLLVLSHVMTGHGLALPLARIARETRARGILVAIDGAHGVGALPLELGAVPDLDFYGGNLHKWALGPKGTAFGWIHPRHQEVLRPIQAGWTTFETPSPQDRFAPNHAFAQRHLHAACIDFAPLMGLQATFRYWKERGPEAIRARIRELQSCVEAEMAARTGWSLLTPAAGPLRGPLLSYELPASLEAEGYELMQRILREHRLQVASSKLQGRWVLRISPHIHNTEDEIARAARILGSLG